MEQTMVPGGWSPWNFHPSEAAKKVFAASLGRLLGVRYTLLASAHQVVNGENYIFLCKADPATFPSLDYIVLVHVHVAPPRGKVTITSFQRVGTVPGTGTGAWSAWQFPPTLKALKVFEEVAGIGLFLPGAPVAFSQQLVAGTEYCFLYEAICPLFIYIFQPLHGEPVLKQVRILRQTDAHFAEALLPEAAEEEVA